MTDNPKVHAMIVAAGRGSRFGASIPKQYLPLNDQTLLQHSVARLASSEYIQECLLVIASEDNIARELSFVMPVQYAIGDAERWQSVQAGVDAIIARGADLDDLVLIHDAARPAVPTSDINRVIEAAKMEHYGAILAAPVADTLKHSKTSIASQKNTDNSYSYISHTIDREDIWQAQTPQVFRIGELQHVLQYVATHNLLITDEASAFEHLGLPIRLVVGSRQNIKLTFPDDAILIAAILHSQL